MTPLSSISGTIVGRPAGGEDAEHTVGKAGVGQDLRERQRAERGLRRRLQDADAAGRDRRTELAGAHGQREVPRDDQQRGADRLLDLQVAGEPRRGGGRIRRRRGPPPRRTSGRTPPRTRPRRGPRAGACPSPASSAARAARCARSSAGARGTGSPSGSGRASGPRTAGRARAASERGPGVVLVGVRDVGEAPPRWPGSPPASGCRPPPARHLPPRNRSRGTPDKCARVVGAGWCCGELGLGHHCLFSRELCGWRRWVQPNAAATASWVMAPALVLRPVAARGLGRRPRPRRDRRGDGRRAASRWSARGSRCGARRPACSPRSSG